MYMYVSDHGSTKHLKLTYIYGKYRYNSLSLQQRIRTPPNMVCTLQKTSGQINIFLMVVYYETVLTTENVALTSK